MKLVYYIIFLFLALSSLFFLMYQLIVPFFLNTFTREVLIPTNNMIINANENLQNYLNVSDNKVTKNCIYNPSLNQLYCYNVSVELYPMEIQPEKNYLLSLIQSFIYMGPIISLLILIAYITTRGQ